MLKESSETHMPCDDIVHHVFHRLYVCLCSCWIGNDCWEVAASLKKIIWKEHAILKCFLWLCTKEKKIDEKRNKQPNQGHLKKKEKVKQNPKESARKGCI